MFKKNYLKFFSIFLVILILIQFSYHQNLLDFYNLNFNFHDLKYSGSYLFLNNENIYEIYLDDPSSKKILGSQYPNYSVTSIYFHIPLGFFSFDFAILIWRIFSIFLLAHIYLIISDHNLKIPNKDFVIFAAMIFLILSKPFHTLINTGNFSIVCLWAYIFFFIGKKNNIFISLFISSIKYSFAPILFFYSLYKKNFFQIFLVILITILALIHFSYRFDFDLMKLIITPLHVGSTSTASGFLDFQTLLGNHPKNIFLRYSLIIITSLISLYVVLKYTQRNQLFDLSVISILTILFYKHLYYDIIFLLPVLIYSFQVEIKKRYILNIIIFYYWFISYLNFFEFLRYWKSFMLFNNILLISCLVILILNNIKSNNRNEKYN